MQDILQYLDNYVMPETDPVFFNPNQLHDRSKLGISRFNYGAAYCTFKPYDLTFKTINKLENLLRINNGCPYFDTMTFTNSAKFLSHIGSGAISFYRPREITGLLEDTGNRLCGVSDDINKKIVLKENKKRKHFKIDSMVECPCEIDPARCPCSDTRQCLTFGTEECPKKVSPCIIDEDMFIFRKSITILGLLAIVCRSYYNNTEFKEFVEKFYLKRNFIFSKKYNLWILNSSDRNAEKQDDLKIATYLKLPASQFQNEIVPYTFKWRDE